MSSDKRRQTEELVRTAAELPAEKRTAFIVEQCQGDLELQAEIESQLAAHHKTRSLFSFSTAPTLAIEDSPSLSNAYLGHRIGAYEIVRELGQGGMGAVFEAVRADEQFAKRVAVKIIRRGMDTDFVVQRFRQERQILASLEHPNIARLLDGGTTTDGLPYIVMEYIEGNPIHEYCDEKRLTIAERLRLFRQVCSAIHYAHQNLVVHRDIKPGNILVTDDGVPKILDFGIAKLLDPDFSPEAIEKTAQAMRLMTPAYASPEQAKGESITTASDIYSLGVLLYQLLTGLRPYPINSITPQDLVRVICEQEPERPSTAIKRREATQPNPDAITEPQSSGYLSEVRKTQAEKLRHQLAGDLDTIILKALHKEPQRRYASVEQFSEDIRRHLEGLPITARTDSFRYRAGKFIQRHKASVSAVTIFIVLLVTVTAVAIQQARSARRERDKAEQRFNQVRKLANAVLFDYHDGIVRLPGSTPVRERMVRDALEYLDNLSQESGNDTSLRGELASAYEKVGLVQGNPYTASFGDYQGALESHRKALALRESLVTLDAQDVPRRTDLAKSYSLVGDLLKVTGESEAMLEHYQKAQSILESLSASAPDNTTVRRELGIAYARVGRVLQARANLNEALEIYGKALALAAETAATQPDNADMRRDEYLANMYMGDVLTEMGRLVEALEYRRKALAMIEPLAAADPTNAQLRRDVGVMLQRLADTQSQSGDHRAALENNRKALAIDEQLWAADPNNAQAKRDLLADHQKIGKLLLLLDNTEGALTEQRKALQLGQELATADPANTEARADLSNCYYKIGDVMMVKKDLRGALEYYQKSLAIDESLSNDDPTNADAQLTVAESYVTVSDIRLQLGDTSGALQGYHKAKAIYESVPASNPPDDTLQRYKSIVNEKIADVLTTSAMKQTAASVENWQAAKRLYQQALDVWLDLQKRNVLMPDEGEQPNLVAQKLAKCDAALQKIEAR